ncbi:MAG: 2,3-bisphosphoglycerate-independent phosphoglycerate mutase [Gemmatimonadetes bacterium]|nr:2,3-bisphosphoglycerate-independent phosphoglycerate mutase [Gemmatimonadota bacterium]
MDGVGGLPHPETGRTELECASTPNLDGLAVRSSLGMMIPVKPGISPGSGPGHLALFGYDPVRFRIGRGVLSALGVGLELEPGDVAARLNLATVDADGRITDRRAGRPSDEEGRRVVAKLAAALEAPEGVDVVLRHEKEHRAVLVLRGVGLSPRVGDTDPQRTNVPPLEPETLAPEAERTAALVGALLRRARELLADETAANAVLARGFAAYERYPAFEERFGLRARAIARYPMYQGVARLVGMTAEPPPKSDEGVAAALAERYGAFEFHFLHFKYTDSRGEDGDFDAKVAAIEAVDRLIPRVMAVAPDVLIVTGDHSTPSRYRAHSWHAVPVLIASPWTRPSAATFGETACRGGDLGIFEACHLMTLALAHAGRLARYGA